MASARSRQASDAAHDDTVLEVIQVPCESHAACLELRENGHGVATLCLEADMLEVFLDLEAAYRQQGLGDSAIMAFRQLSQS
ncbi:hypothetical protein SAMN05421848_0179 [Kushneria avicenniae]|uniref:Uncharacterized protein n=1 Tax=Kushneria avicenniae TaxID=402385 RepID=A0A1I1FSR2_9GAMM|nr:hypothetical protein [Kushneria avicenniae]SFC00020.1 hypothetical protein SAMN05421848_0179 [Kushneria avicenniae]